MLSEVLAGLSALLPPEHWMLGVSRACVRDCLADLGRAADAVKQYEAAVSIPTAALDKEHAGTTSVVKKLANAKGAGGATPPAPPAS